MPIFNVRINEEQPYQHFNLNLTNEQKKTLEDLTINRANAFTSYGDLENLLTDVKKFLISVGSIDSVAFEAAKIIVEIVEKVIKTFNQETAEVVLRSSLPNDLFKIPRWHTDGYYYSPHEGEQYKAVVTLTGPGTLFYTLPSEQREAFNRIQEDRLAAAEMLKNVVPDTPASGQGTFFIAGHPKHSAVHSEPHIDRNRLFCAVVPGTKNNIKEMEEKQKEFENSPEYKVMVENLLKQLKL